MALITSDCDAVCSPALAEQALAGQHLAPQVREQAVHVGDEGGVLRRDFERQQHLVEST